MKRNPPARAAPWRPSSPTLCTRWVQCLLGERLSLLGVDACPGAVGSGWTALHARGWLLGLLVSPCSLATELSRCSLLSPWFCGYLADWRVDMQSCRPSPPTSRLGWFKQIPLPCSGPELFFFFFYMTPDNHSLFSRLRRSSVPLLLFTVSALYPCDCNKSQTT